MPQPKRARRAPGPRSSVAAAADHQSPTGGWLSGRRNSSASRRAEDDGTSLTNEILLFIFATFLEITDLVRCAATCRRWRRLVSGEAAFLCRGLRRPGPGGRFLPGLAVGFFHELDVAATRFVPMASASRRFPALRQPSLSLSTLVGGWLRERDSSRIVASRNGLLVVQLRRSGKRNRALKLCVCNPMTGAARVLPPLTGKDGVGYFVCTVITADDYQVQGSDAVSAPRRLSSPHYRLLVLYNRRDFTACRSYSSEDGSWSPERRVAGAQLGKMQMRGTRGGVVAGGGRAAYWMTNRAVFELRLDTLEAKIASLPKRGGPQAFMTRNTALGMTPEGELCVVHLGSTPVQGKRNDAVGSPPVQGERNDAVGSPPEQDERHDAVEIRLFCYGGPDDDGLDGGTWKEKQCFRIKYRARAEGNLPSDACSYAMVKLQWFGEKSGVVFFTAGSGRYDDPRSELYAVSLGTHPMVERVESNEGDGSVWLWGNLYGYEMDQAAYLASLAEPEED